MGIVGATAWRKHCRAVQDMSDLCFRWRIACPSNPFMPWRSWG
jgi:hypothetical protein